MGGGGDTTVIQAPQAPNYQESMKSILQAQVEMAPEVYASEQKYQPLYNALQAAQQAFQVQQGLNIAKQAYPQIADMESAYNQANRQAELQQLQTTLPEYQQAFNSLTPGYAESVAGAGQLAQQSMRLALDRPNFSAFESGVRDPYGRSVATQQPTAQTGYAQPQRPVPTQLQQRPVQQAQPASNIQYDKGLEETFKQFAVDMQGKLPGMTAAPKDPGGAIAPVYQRIGRGNATRITNQAAIDTRNAEIAKYQADLAVFKDAEAKRQAGAAEYLGNFNPAAALAQIQSAPAQKPTSRAAQVQQTLQKATEKAAQRAASAKSPEASKAPVSAVGGPGISVGQMQGPALPQGPQQPFSSLQDTVAGGYVNAVQGFTPANVSAMAGMPQEAGYLNRVQSPSLAAIVAGQVPDGYRMSGVNRASTAAESAGAVPQAIATASAMGINDARGMAGSVPTASEMATAQTAAQAAGMAGSVPSSNLMTAVTPADQAAQGAGAVPDAQRMAAAQTAARAAAEAGNVPAAANVAGMRTVDAALQGIESVPQAQNAMAAQTAQSALQAAGAVPGAQNILNAQSAQSALQQAGAVPAAMNLKSAQSAQAAARTAGSVPSTVNLQGVSGPSLASNIQQLDRNAVDQYISTMPGMGNYANMLAQQSQAELSAGKGLTAEEQRMADQSARAAYAARGTALGNQAVSAEILNRADVSNQRYQQRLQNAAQAAGTIQAIYQPALQQSMQRQQLGIDYGLGLQQQAFSQAQARDVLNQQTQAQRYAQAMGTQGTAFGQAATIDQIAAQLQAQRFGQLSQTQQAGFQQAAAQDQALAQLQAQRFEQLSSTQQAGFQQATNLDALAQQRQAQQYAQAMGAQTTGFEQAQERDVLAAQLQAQRYGQLSETQQVGFGQAQAQDAAAQSLQAQRYAQAMGTQGASFGQAQDITAMQQALQQQRYAQFMGTQGAGFGQAQARDEAAQSLQAQRYAQAMGFQTTGFEQAQAKDAMDAQLQAQRYGQAMGTQGAGFQQAQSQDVFGREAQAQRYAQLMGTQGAQFEQAMGREGLSQQIQQQRYGQLMGQQQLMQGAQEQAYNQAMGREQLGAGTQQAAFNQALQRGQSQQQRLQNSTAIQAGQAQLGMGAMSQLQSAQAPILQAFYKQPILQGQESQAQQLGMMMQQQAGPQYFNPESQTGMGSIYGAYNSQMNLAGAQAQANAAKSAGKSSMFGAIGGGLLVGAGMAF